MPVFPKPKFAYTYDLNTEVAHLRAHKQKRSLPARTADTLLAATWNIANLGVQQRGDNDRALIAEVLSWFDIVAIQECRENAGDLFGIQYLLGDHYRILMTDTAGNNERMAFLYDTRKLTIMEEIGEVAYPPSQHKDIKLPGITQGFDGFDRPPFFVAFDAGTTSLVFVNVHLYYGDEKSASIERRALETFALAKWVDRRSRSKYSYARELVALGDFNMPKSEKGDPIYNALTKLGLELPDHSTQIASSIASDSNYDQIAFLPGTTKNCYKQKGVFDYDMAVFPDLWNNGANKKNFNAYLRYYISDHRPMWVQLNTKPALP